MEKEGGRTRRKADKKNFGHPWRNWLPGRAALEWKLVCFSATALAFSVFFGGLSFGSVGVRKCLCPPPKNIRKSLLVGSELKLKKKKNQKPVPTWNRMEARYSRWKKKLFNYLPTSICEKKKFMDLKEPMNSGKRAALRVLHLGILCVLLPDSASLTFLVSPPSACREARTTTATVANRTRETLDILAAASDLYFLSLFFFVCFLVVLSCFSWCQPVWWWCAVRHWRRRRRRRSGRCYCCCCRRWRRLVPCSSLPACLPACLFGGD